jgi:hypothetical protein
MHPIARALRFVSPIAIACACAFVVVTATAIDPDRDISRAGSSQDASSDEQIEKEVKRIRSATMGFKSLDIAAAQGYARDVAHCLENPPQGGMGYHHQNDALMDDKIELERPEILVYERLSNGDYRLNGVEYIVPFSARPPDAAPPTVMGQKLKRAPQLGIWYLHVWVWLENPSGLFADWNPRVKC